MFRVSVVHYSLRVQKVTTTKVTKLTISQIIQKNNCSLFNVNGWAFYGGLKLIRCLVHCVRWGEAEGEG
jgi:hypothetical protein